MNLWRCSVCGELIHSEEAPSLCPRCGVGAEFFDLVEEPEIAPIASDKHIVIIGNGIAGFSVAKTLRELDTNCRIDMFSEEDDVSYDRTQLSKFLRDINKDAFLLEPLSWYKEQNIHLHLSTKVTQINVNEKSILCDDGAIFPYDDLVLAMGAKSYIPPIPNADLNQIFTLRSKDDAIDILSASKPDRSAIVIGGGILGLELACSLADLHVNVEVIEALPSIMARQLDSIAAELLTNYINKQKITIHTNTQVKEFHGHSRVETVELSDGRCLNCDFVVLSTGIYCDLSLLETTPIKCKKSVPVDEHMRTNIEHIYACGDIASFEDKHLGLWSIAQEQAMVVAYNIAQSQSTFQYLPQPIYFKHDEFSLFSIGDVHKMDQHVELLDDAKQTYEKYGYMEDGCSGILIVNKPDQIAKAIAHFQRKEKFPR